ncbi:MAG: hypothetical protein A2Y24_06590 [Clostridiales bacterium GWE2_32_10]|nr:MAG: hypothetical protein A2Y24_06590 [Clostridiales bacterium GWE2_32_10]
MGKVNILSIDGGGIRGIIPAIILDYIYKKTRTPIHRLFKYIAGTSTGGIIALGLTKANYLGKHEYIPEDMVSLYEKEGEKIFKPKNQLDNIINILGEKHNIKDLNNVTRSYFKQAYLSQALTNVIIPSYDIKNGKPYFFKTDKAREDEKEDFLISDICCATAAAPTYFEPYAIGNNVYIDGGIFANNPSMCALAEVLKKDKEVENILLISIGTGEFIKEYKYEEVKNWGMLNWVRPVIDTSINGNAQTVDYQMTQILNKGNRNYYRFEAKIDKSLSHMDNASDANIKELKNIAYNYVEENKELLDEACTKINTN